MYPVLLATVHFVKNCLIDTVTLKIEHTPKINPQISYFHRQELTFKEEHFHIKKVHILPVMIRYLLLNFEFRLHFYEQKIKHLLHLHHTKLSVHPVKKLHRRKLSNIYRYLNCQLLLREILKLISSLFRGVEISQQQFFQFCVKMEEKRKQTDISTRKLIINLYCKRKSLRDIGEIVGRTHSTVQKSINKYRYEGTLENSSGRGRKKSYQNTTNDLLCEKSKRILRPVFQSQRQKLQR